MRKTRLDDGGSKCDRRLDKNFTDVDAVTEPPAAALKASDRQRTLNDFRRGTVPILIATDLESRALDVEHLTHVFKYDYPLNIGKYLYRVQRAGRAGRRGFSVTIVTRQEWMQARDLIDVLEEANEYVPEERTPWLTISTPAKSGVPRRLPQTAAERTPAMVTSGENEFGSF
ncbi:hypothetical protein HPB49_022359 [Dermacentor silvarum]|uniref:Uncharacterized protein n=1 Tax=Dermacentor silvarum TaxID=543639 RepID=A0ACB8E3J8_DERSI|nr:hypothetical protein HPB49_022359 [Dermacentor silvarum]